MDLLFLISVSPDMLFRRLFFRGLLFDNPDWYMEWLGMVDLRTLPPPPLFLWQSPSVERAMEWKWWLNLTVSLVFVAVWAEDNQAIPKSVYVLSFDSSVTVLQSNRVVSLTWIWIGIGFCE